MKLNKLLALLLAVSLLAGVLAGCSGRDEAVESDSTPESSSAAEPDELADPISSIIPDYLERIQDMKEINDDVIGWLQVPNTDIDDAVLWYPDDENDFYYRLNINKEYDFNGVYYADFRNTFGDGSPLDTSITIYGHAMDDDLEKLKTNIKFGPLHNFRKEEFARKTPYFFFSTEEENYAYEVMAVFTSNVHNPNMNYNAPAETGKEYVDMINEWVLPRSYYNYDVDFDENDKFMCLSFCIYLLEDGTDLGYPNDLRCVVMGRLVDPDQPLKEEASFTINEDQIFDPDGGWKQ